MEQPGVAVHTTFDSTPDRVNYRRAWRAWRWAFFILLIGGVTGAAWDGLWHISQPFDGFWSPPHVFVYGVCTLTGFIVVGMVFSGAIRRAFGPAFAVGIVPFRVPGALFILGSGLVLVGFAGLVLDNYWHSNFGLDETSWSFPHAMLGWTILLVVLGFISCRLALRSYKPLRWWSTVGLGTMVLIFTARPILGPLEANRTLETVRSESLIPVFLTQPPTQHAFRIVEEWNLTRTNPMLIVLGALWAGAALAFIRRLDNRAGVLLLIALLWEVSDSARNRAEWLSQYGPLSNNPANYLALPILVPAIVLLLLLRVRVAQKWAWLGAGLAFGLMVYSIWHTPNLFAFGLTLLAAPMMLVGKFLGEHVYGLVEKPYSLSRVAPLLLAAVVAPLVTGLADLWLRSATP